MRTKCWWDMTGLRIVCLQMFYFLWLVIFLRYHKQCERAREVAKQAPKNKTCRFFPRPPPCVRQIPRGIFSWTQDLRYTTLDNHVTYSANSSLSSCSELPFPRLATNSVVHGGFPKLAMWCSAVGDANAGIIGWCWGKACKEGINKDNYQVHFWQ